MGQKVGRKPVEHKAKVVNATIPHHQAEILQAVVDLNDPDYPTKSRIVQAALREWFDNHVEQEYVLKGGKEILSVKIVRSSVDSSEKRRDSRPALTDIMDPFASFNY